MCVVSYAHPRAGLPDPFTTGLALGSLTGLSSVFIIPFHQFNRTGGTAIRTGGRMAIVTRVMRLPRYVCNDMLALARLPVGWSEMGCG